MLGPWRPWRRAFAEYGLAVERLAIAGRPPVLLWGKLCLAVLGSWFLYVPVHELLHAAGCALAGGDVVELQVHPLYGGRVLAGFLPFVQATGDYAGRLSRYEAHGSLWVDLSTVLAPFVPTTLGAMALLRSAGRRRSAALLGLGAVLAAAPAVSLGGDLYEAGALVVGATWHAVSPPGALDVPAAIRHDDLLLLLRQFGERFPEGRPLGMVLIALSAALGALLGSVMLAASDFVARLGEPRTALR